MLEHWYPTSYRLSEMLPKPSSVRVFPAHQWARYHHNTFYQAIPQNICLVRQGSMASIIVRDVKSSEAINSKLFICCFFPQEIPFMKPSSGPELWKPCPYENPRLMLDQNPSPWGYEWPSRTEYKQQGSKYKNRVSTEPKKTLTRAPFHIGASGLMHGWEKPGETKISKIWLKYSNESYKGIRLY